jgi:hypothetical protein
VCRRASLGTATTGAPSRRWPPRVFVWRCRLIPKLHHDAPVPSSPITGATSRSSSLAPVSPSAELPPWPRDLSGEPLLPNVPQMSLPPHRVALAAVRDPPHRWQMPEFGRPLPPLSWHRGHSPTSWWATSPERRRARALSSVGRSLGRGPHTVVRAMGCAILCH